MAIADQLWQHHLHDGMRQSMCLPISAWKFSRAMHEAGARWSRIQVSQPWSNIGMTQVSKILKAESGFNDPWNAPTFPSKEVVLALAMFSLTDSLAERSLRKVLSSVHTVFPQNDLRGRSFYCIDHSDQSFWQLHTASEMIIPWVVASISHPSQSGQQDWKVKSFLYVIWAKVRFTAISCVIKQSFLDEVYWINAG